MNRIIDMGEKSVQRIKNFPILIPIIANLIIILFILPHYGESWDENSQYNHYAEHALKAYEIWFREGRSEGLIQPDGTIEDFHGPAFVMTVELLTNLISRGISDVSQTDIHHLLHFLTFQIGLFSFYTICRRWLETLPSLGATLLFMTQPVFWGHGIINPKDMPFAALFLLSISLGLQMYDYLFPIIWEQVSSSWFSLEVHSRRRIVLIVSIWTLSIIAIFAGTKIISDILTNLIANANLDSHSNPAVVFSVFARGFAMFAINVRIQRLFIYFLRLRGVYTTVSTIFMIWMLYKKFQPGLKLLGAPVLLAGFALGFITSTRVAGPLAGILISIYILGKAGKKATLPVLIYGFIAVVVMYLTWPYLWTDPVKRLLGSLQIMSAYPRTQSVLFNGIQFPANSLPVSYLATLFTIQLTEPVWFLFFAGVTATVVGFVKRREYGWLLFLLLGWFMVPFLVFSIGGFSLYDNFRQVLFILPPIFLMAGVAFSRIKQPKMQVALIVLVILPGIIDGIRLHPYEYIYYNRFVGGVAGAQGKFELDYWAISYREAAEYVNRIAQPDSFVWVEGPAHVFKTFARKDLKVLDAYGPELEKRDYYFVALSRYNLDLLAPNADVIHTISRDGVPLTVIKKKQ